MACHVMGFVQGLRRQHEYESRHTQVLKVVKFVGEAWEVTDAIAVTVGERSDVEFIENRIFVHCESMSSS
jgi:hypothetical protein